MMAFGWQYPAFIVRSGPKFRIHPRPRLRMSAPRLARTHAHALATLLSLSGTQALELCGTAAIERLAWRTIGNPCGSWRGNRPENDDGIMRSLPRSLFSTFPLPDECLLGTISVAYWLGLALALALALACQARRPLKVWQRVDRAPGKGDRWVDWVIGGLTYNPPLDL
ncbi:uncharacterized protein LOC108659530 [Drosophila navojoa]|uniref:uncharacterized protein LOC108659530 n=1 Tax=Drosophila navojoa TaxID=7232 RepID=UPI000847B0D5|nr:uncharacterized protein LOC108659530 [Drosophila navojoa]